jgi:hypothetical protein
MWAAPLYNIFPQKQILYKLRLTGLTTNTRAVATPVIGGLQAIFNPYPANVKNMVS